LRSILSRYFIHKSIQHRRFQTIISNYWRNSKNHPMLIRYLPIKIGFYRMVIVLQVEVQNCIRRKLQLDIMQVLMYMFLGIKEIALRTPSCRRLK